MTKTLLNAAPKTPLAGLGLTHGYLFDGDNAQLNAAVFLHDTAQADELEWALQLWACADSGKATPEHGSKVAEVCFGTPFAAGETSRFLQGSAIALPPAGTGEYTLLLALASATDGQFDCIHDFIVFPQSETFVQPRLAGELSHTLADGSVQLNIGAIENPRQADNLSGTLALELWLLDAPYTSNQWSGTPVASLVLGSLAGECAWSPCEYTATAALPEKPGYLTLMLREWTPAGYVTRDFRTLAEPQVVPATTPETESPAVEKVAAKPAKKPAAAKKVPVAEKTAASAAPAPVAAEKKPASGISVNTGTEAELIALKGLGATVARAIIAARPYVSLDDLCRAKGMGAKLLEKVKSQLKL
jgi:DNA uptake protein ComE-like DNA-binding protein